MTANDYWLALEEPWRTAVTLAWEGYVGGNVGVGAVLTDPDGRVVAVGRNRGSDSEAPPGRLRSTPIAHAELDVLGQLRPGRLSDATRSGPRSNPARSVPWPLSRATSGTLLLQQATGSGTEYPGSQNSTNSSQAVGLSGADHSAAPISVFCELLPLLWFLEHKPSGSVVAKYESQHPRLLALAGTLRKDARLIALRADSVSVALSQLWTDLTAIE